MEVQSDRKSKLDHPNDIETPDWIADVMVKWADPIMNTKILEPTCGKGSLLRAVERFYVAMKLKSSFRVYGYEVNPERAAIAKKAVDHGVDVECANFLTLFPPANEFQRSFEVALINPPFSGAHEFISVVVEKWLKQNYGTRAICLVPQYYLTNSERRKKWLKKHTWRIGVLPKHAFREMGCDTLHTFLIELRPFEPIKPVEFEFITKPE